MKPEQAAAVGIFAVAALLFVTAAVLVTLPLGLLAAALVVAGFGAAVLRGSRP